MKHIVSVYKSSKPNNDDIHIKFMNNFYPFSDIKGKLLRPSVEFAIKELSEFGLSHYKKIEDKEKPHLYFYKKFKVEVK